MKKYFKSAARKTVKHILGYDPRSTWSRYTIDALKLVNQFDCSLEQLLEQQQHPERVAANVRDRTCNWYLPLITNPFYGGVMTILRLADYLLRHYGIKQRIIICNKERSEEAKAKIARAFPALAQSEVIVLNGPVSVADIPPSDYSVATFWTTAYIVLQVKNTGYKFYMIQDFEPAFYPAGSTYAQVELTYHFGFYGIANTQSLKEIYEQDYGGCAVLVRPNIDKTVFYPGAPKKTESVKRLFYYARPGAPRNGFELAVTALKMLKLKYGSSIDIVCAGADWNPADYGLESAVRTVGMLPYAETGELYRSCHIGLALMMTKHPSYPPFELMACGAIVVTNFNQANTWLLKNRENCLLSAPVASCLSETLSYGLDHYEELAPLRECATTQMLTEFGDWDKSLDDAANFMLNPPAEFVKRQSVFG